MTAGRIAEPRLEVSPDIVLFLGPKGELLIYHVRARTYLEVNPGVLTLLRAVASSGASRDASSDQAEALASAVAGASLRLRGVTREGTLSGLFADPGNLDDGALEEPLEGQADLPLDIALERLVEHLVVYRDERAYRERFGLKTCEADDRHVGNFYQHLTDRLRSEGHEPESWWVGQKFEPEVRGVRQGPYRSIQYHYLEKAFPRGSLAGRRVLDLGCGPGYYSAFFADRGGDVLGLDPSEAHLALARERFLSPTCRFKKLKLRRGKILPLVKERYDLIWISDTLLFYFALPHLVHLRDTLLRRLGELLRPGGDLVVMDPHGVFWLTPWLGAVGEPFTILAEYGSEAGGRRFRVTPTLGELVGALTGAGFVIRRLDEPSPDAAYETIDPRGYAFACRFPLWWVIWARPGGT